MCKVKTGALTTQKKQRTCGEPGTSNSTRTGWYSMFPKGLLHGAGNALKQELDYYLKNSTCRNNGSS